MTRKTLSMGALGTTLTALTLAAAPLAAQTQPGAPVPQTTGTAGTSTRVSRDSLTPPGASNIPGNAPNPVPPRRVIARDSLSNAPATTAPMTTAPADTMSSMSNAPMTTAPMAQPVDSTRMMDSTRMNTMTTPPASGSTMSSPPTSSPSMNGTSNGALDTTSDTAARPTRSTTRMRVRKDGY